LLNIDTDIVREKIKVELYEEFGDRIYLAVDKIPEIYSLIIRERQKSFQVL
jgi:hypothetical protein